MVRRLYRFFRFLYQSEGNYTLAVCNAASVLLLTGFIKTAPIFFLLLLGLTVCIWLRTRTILVSVFLVSLFSLPFFQPNKYYATEVFKGGELAYDIYLGSETGYQLGYGLIVANIFVFLSFVLLIRELLRTRPVARIFYHSMPVLITLGSSLGFFVVALYATLRYSPYVVLSIVWLFQYVQLFIIALVTLGVFLTNKKNFRLINFVVFSSLLFQTVIGLWQFLRQSSIGLPIEYLQQTSVYYSGLDEINTLFRVPGTLVSPNQLALVVITFVSMILPYAIRKNKGMLLFTLVLGISVIILTQSRSVWISSSVIFGLYMWAYRRDLLVLGKIFGLKKLAFVATVFFFCLSYVIIPRVLLSANTFFEGAGLPIRQRMVREGMEALLQNLWTGYGIGTNEYVLLSFFPNGVVSVFPAPVHLGYLQMALEVGIIGLTLFLGPFIYSIKMLLPRVFTLLTTETPSRMYVFPFVTGLIAYALYYLFQPYAGILEFPFLGITLGFGLIAVYLQNHETVETHSK